MSKKLDEFFNIEGTDIKPKENLPATIDTYNELVTLDKEIGQVVNVDHYGQEMDEIAKQAMDSYKDLMEKGGEAEDRDAGKIFDAAVHMMKNAIDAKTSKITAKLKKYELLVKAQKLNEKKIDDASIPGEIIRANRNDILREE